MNLSAPFGRCALAVLAGVAVLWAGPAAQADPGSGFSLVASRTTLHSGERFTATATARTRCDWALAWNGVVQHRKAQRLAATFTAPTVTRPTRIVLHGTCAYLPPTVAAPPPPVRSGGGASERIVVNVPGVWQHTVLVTVLPAGSAVSAPQDGAGNTPGHGGSLPPTGGPRISILAAGLAAALLGSILVRASKRRRRSAG